MTGPIHPSSSPSQELARQLAKTLAGNDPEPWGIVRTLMKMGVVGPDTAVDENGAGLMDMALNRILQSPNTYSLLTQDIMAKNSMAWIEAAGGHLFSRRTSEGQWVPLAWMKKLVEAGRDAREKLYTTEQMDQWFSTTLPLLDMSDNEATEALVGALRLGLLKTSALVWDAASKTAEVDGKPVLAHAKSGWAWERFLGEGGNPHEKIKGVPLWRALLPTKLIASPKSSLVGTVERWAWTHIAQGQGSEQDRDWLEDRVRRHLKKAVTGIGSEDWLLVLAATRFPGPLWDSQNGPPAWVELAQTIRDPHFLKKLAHSPLAVRVDQARLGTMYADLLTRRLWEAINVAAPQALEDWAQAFTADTWPADAKPPVLELALAKLAPTTFKKVASLAKQFPQRWWGTVDDVESLLLDQAMAALTKGSEYTGKVTVVDVLTQGRHHDPRIQLVRGIARLGAGRDQEAMELFQDCEALLAPDTDIGSQRHQALQAWSGRLSEKRRVPLTRFLESVSLRTRLAPASPERIRPGRL